VTVVAVSTIVWALVLLWADRRAARNHVGGLREVGVWRALAVGLAQPLSLIPGTSRSGITLSAGLFVGLDRPTAARFAFLLGLPITLAAGLLQARALIVSPPAGEGPGVILLGVVTSFVAGLAAIRFLVAYLQRRTLVVFVVYRIVLGVLLLAFARG
jgi:undecaprenyl-diphosphatase